MKDAENQLDIDWYRYWYVPMKLGAYWKWFGARKHRWLGRVLGHYNFLHDIIEGKTMDRAALGRKRRVLLLFRSFWFGSRGIK